MNSFSVVLWTAKDLGEAKRIVSLLLEKKAIACATMLDHAYSMYIWNEKIEFEKEVQVIIKSINSNFSKIKSIIETNCSYEVPEILEIEVKNGSKSYLNWIKSSVS